MEDAQARAEQWRLRCQEVGILYADAAERMQAAGLDGVEIQIYGHLADQFLSPLTNFRGDAFGGPIENRMRFPMEEGPAFANSQVWGHGGGSGPGGGQ